MEIHQVNDLPALNQCDFPALPKIPDGKHLVCFGTKWTNAEMEWAAGCIVTVCIRASQWVPITTVKVLSEMKSNPIIPPPKYEDVVNALRTLIEKGDIGVVRHQGSVYIIPTPGFAYIVLTNLDNIGCV